MLLRAVVFMITGVVLLGAPGIGRACSGSLHVELRDAGVYRLDHAAVVAAQPGLDGCASDDLVLTRAGSEVPIRIVGDRDGRFAEGAHIEWVGKPLHGPESWFHSFATFNVYILSAAPGEHRRMREFAPAPAAARPAPLLREVHLEQQELLVRLDRSTMQPGDEPDFWQWAKLTNADARPFDLAFDLDDLDPSGAASARVTLALRGMSSASRRAGPDGTPDHVVELVLNGQPLRTLEWDGGDEQRIDVELPLDSLKATGNTLAMRTPKRNHRSRPDLPVVDVVMLNWADLAYPIRGDLERSRAPFRSVAADGPRVVEVFGGPADVAFYGESGAYRPAATDGAARQRFLAADATIHAVTPADFREPVLVRKVADRDLRHPGAGYDYLMVSHPNLMDAVEPLAEFHRQRGLRVAVIDVDAIYDQFHAGIVHPSAIRDYLAWGHAHWEIKPRYVLLVGTASFDLRHSADPSYNEHQVQDPRTGTGKVQRPDTARLAEFAHPGKRVPDRNLVPTWQYPSPQGQSATDNPYVAFGDSDFHPVIAIGRLPVVTPEDVTAIVQKTIDYATHPEPGAWRSKVMFITNESPHFHRASDRIAEDIEREGFTAEKVYASSEEANNVEHQAAIKSNLNEGNLLVHFLGHGGRFIWRSGPPDYRKNHDLFTLDDVSALHNGGRLPMVLSMTCYSGSFDNPNSDTIGERFLRERDKGAVAVLAASWSNAPSTTFSKDLVDKLLEPGMRIGDAIVAAKANSTDRVLVETYNLFGDPALVLDRPRGTVEIARAADRWNQRIAVRLPNDRFDGRVTVNWLDAGGIARATHSYAANDRLFELPVPSGDFAGVSIYAEDTRSGADALGFLDLRPPEPEPEPEAEVDVATKPAPAVQPARIASARPAPARPSNLPDPIGRFDFERTPAPDSPGGDAADHDGSANTTASAAAVAVDPGTGKGQP